MFETILRRSAAPMLVVVLAMATGCSEFVESPTTSVDDVDRTVLSQTAPEGMTGMIVLTPKALLATKQTLSRQDDLLWAINTDWFKPESNGKLRVKFPSRDLDDERDEAAAFVKQATFTFRKRSIGVDDDPDLAEPPQPVRGKYEIGMAVSSGEILDDISIVFGPSGLVFAPAAKVELKVTASSQALQEGTLVGYHISQGGKKVTRIEILVKQEKKTQWKLVFDVPGFSRYDWGYDESAAHDNEGCGWWPLRPCSYGY